MEAPCHVRAQETIFNHFFRTAFWRGHEELHGSQGVANDGGEVFPPCEYNTIMVMTYDNDYDNNDFKGIGVLV